MRVCYKTTGFNITRVLFRVTSRLSAGILLRSISHKMADTVSRWPFTSEVRVIPCGISGRQGGTLTGVSSNISPFSPVIVSLPMVCIRFQLKYCYTRRTSGRSLGNLTQTNAVSDIGERWTDKYFHIVPVRLQRRFARIVDTQRACICRGLYSRRVLSVAKG